MCYAKKLVGFYSDGTEKNLGCDFDGQFDCVRYKCNGCDHGLIDGEPPKRNLRLSKISTFHELYVWQNLNPLKRFPFEFERQLGSGGFATVYKGLFHGVERAFKVVPLDEEKHQYNVESYGCHEYYNQENDFKSRTFLKVNSI